MLPEFLTRLGCANRRRYLRWSAWAIAAMIIGALIYSLANPPPFNPDDEMGLMSHIMTLKEVAGGIQDYHDSKKRLPPAYSTDDEGKPLLSWRVLILPYVGEEALWNEFHQDEPWDSEHNSTLIAKCPSIYKCNWDSKCIEEPWRTHIQVFVGPGTLFERPNLSFKNVFDPLDQTVLAVETEESVVWTQPTVLTFAPDQPLPKLRGTTKLWWRRDGKRIFLNAPVNLLIFADGVVHFILPEQLDDRTLRAFITRNGGEKILLPENW